MMSVINDKLGPEGSRSKENHDPKAGYRERDGSKRDREKGCDRGSAVGLAAGPGGRSCTAGPGMRDGGSVAGAEGGADDGTARLPVGVVSADAGDAGRQTEAAGAAGPQRPVPDRCVRAVPAKREGSGCGAERDVCAGRFDEKGKGSDRAVVRARVFLVNDQPDDGEAGRGFGEVCRPGTGSGVSVPDSG